MGNKRHELVELFNDYEYFLREAIISSERGIKMWQEFPDSYPNPHQKFRELREKIIEILEHYDTEYREDEGYICNVPLEWREEMKDKLTP